MEHTKNVKDFELKVKFVCKKCGRESNADGHHIFHRSGTISFLVYNVNKECRWCIMEKEQEEKKKQELEKTICKGVD